MQKTAAIMSNIRPAMKPLQDRMAELRASGDVEGSRIVAGELQQLFAKHQISPFSGLVGLLNIPFFIGPFFAIQQLAADASSGMAQESLAWLPSLAQSDPFYVLPTLGALLQVLQMEYSAEFSKSQGAAMSDNMRNVFRGAAILSIPFVAKFPVAVSLFWMTNSMVLFLQMLLLRNPSIRSFFGIPQIVTPVNLNVMSNVAGKGAFGPGSSMSAEAIKDLRMASGSSSAPGTTVLKNRLAFRDAKRVVAEAERGVNR
jgi:YidC/Oxa1 family membrane protein insertase